MPFQFQCPQGHLLEAEPFQAGQQCVCPMCGQPFLIPSPVGSAAPGSVAPGSVAHGAGLPGSVGVEQHPGGYPQTYGQVETHGHVEPQPEPEAQPSAAADGSSSGPVLPFATQNTATLPLLHIPCPKGHELEVPRDMLNQFVECPQCQAQFTLRERDSVEFKKMHSAEMERRWEKTGQAWLQWAIIFAVLVVIGLITLIALS